jgi:hypothetical protein
MLANRAFKHLAPHTRRQSTIPVSVLPVVYSRFQKTIDVIGSKIFPAGFGWQAASVVAGSWGHASDSLGFALLTGAGDFAGVLAGHTLYTVGKSYYTGVDANKSGLPVGLWLASAAFCSGTAWQPTVNALSALDLGFVPTALATGAVTGATFYAGLRVGRQLFAPIGLEPSSSANAYDDAMLSVSIGGATGTFLGTDISFADNLLQPVFGVEPSMGAFEGMLRAGGSTSAGFFAVQGAQNFVLPLGANWLDPPARRKAA